MMNVQKRIFANLSSVGFPGVFKGALQAFAVIFVLAAVVGCNRATSDSSSPDGVTTLTEKLSYPHAKGWAQPSQHGAAYVAAIDKTSCLACHDSTQKESTATRCDSCHAAFPHPPKYKHNHGQIAPTFAGKCLNCHRGYVENLPQKMRDNGGCISCHDGQLKIQWVEDPPVVAAPAPGNAP